MVFSSFLFIFAFLPVFLSLYLLLPWRAKNLFVLLASYLFYAWGAPRILPVLLASSLLDYVVVRKMNPSEGRRRWGYCFLGVFVNLSFLAYYKYANFFVEQLSYFGVSVQQWSAIALPIGISFFTFQKISYIIDVYRRESAPAASVVDYLLYVVLFPQLIAGPILRYHDVDAQLRSRSINAELFLYGVFRFCMGLAKKVLLANEMGAVSENVLGLSPDALSWHYAWIGAVAYSFQIYFDFSGYSDMAIGLCAMMGFRILENFNMPYRSASIGEFWRRWHISLSNWMKEYLYIPLGGNRGSIARTAINLWIVFLLSGLWHGASWTFVAWGALHGLFLSLERVGRRYLPLRVPRVLGIIYVWLVLLLTWVLFRAENFTVAWDYLSVALRFEEAVNPAAIAHVIHLRGRFAFFVCSFLVLFSLHPRLAAWVEQHYAYPQKRVIPLFLVSYGLFLASVVTLATTAFNPFIYFRF